MQNILYILVQIVLLLLSVVNLAMLVRAITSWIPDVGGAWLNFVYAITEPVVAPVRAFFGLFPIFRNSPIDFSFLISFLLLAIVRELVYGFAEMVL